MNECARRSLEVCTREGRQEQEIKLLWEVRFIKDSSGRWQCGTGNGPNLWVLFSGRRLLRMIGGSTSPHQLGRPKNCPFRSSCRGKLPHPSCSRDKTVCSGQRSLCLSPHTERSGVDANECSSSYESHCLDMMPGLSPSSAS